jgi:hypothetical protein
VRPRRGDVGSLTAVVETVQRDGLETARARFGSAVVAQLHTFLDQPEKLTVPDLVVLVTAALIPDVVEDEHERRADELRAAIDEHAERKRSDAGYAETLPPSRASRGSHGAAGEVGSAQQVVIVGDEHVLVGVAGEVMRQ